MDLFALLDDIQTIARNGLHYSRDPYERERYARLLTPCGYLTGSSRLSLTERGLYEKLSPPH
jgi:hypothetical protein